MHGRGMGNAIQASAKVVQRFTDEYKRYHKCMAGAWETQFRGVQKECKGSAKHCEMLSRGMGNAIQASAKVMNTTEIANARQVHRKTVQGRTNGIQK